MPDPLKFVQPGSRVRHSAGRENALIAAARKINYSRRPGLPGRSGVTLSQTVISVQNGTTALIDLGGVVGLDLLLIEPDGEHVLPDIVYKAVAPTADHAAQRKLAILAEAASPGDSLAKAYVSGVFPALINFSSVDDLFAKVDPGTTDSLISDPADGEYQILSTPPSTGEQWVIVTPRAGGGSIPTGQYQGMVLQMLTDLQAGYGFLVSHAMESVT